MQKASEKPTWVGRKLDAILYQVEKIDNQSEKQPKSVPKATQSEKQPKSSEKQSKLFSIQKKLQTRNFRLKLDEFVLFTKRVPKCCLFSEPKQSNWKEPQNAREQ